MVKKQKTNKKPQVKLTVMEQVIIDLKLQSHEFKVLGAGAHLHKGSVFLGDLATKQTLFSTMAVPASAYLFAEMNRAGNVVQQGKHRLISVLGDGPNGHFGFYMVDGTKVGNLYKPEVAFQFMVELLDFSTLQCAAVSMNILSYMASCDHFKEKLKAIMTYDWVKAQLWRDSNLGRVLFMEPSYIYLGMISVADARGMKEMLDPFFRKEYDKAQDQDHVDPDVQHYWECANNPNFLMPNGKTVGGQDFSDGPLFQTTMDPDPEVIQPYDPNL